MTRARIGEALRDLRERSWPRLSAFAEKTRLYENNIKKIESGRSYPRIDGLERWLAACGLKLSEFFRQLEVHEPEMSTLDQAVQDFRLFAARDPASAQQIVEAMRVLAEQSAPVKKAAGRSRRHQ